MSLRAFSRFADRSNRSRGNGDIRSFLNGPNPEANAVKRKAAGAHVKAVRDIFANTPPTINLKGKSFPPNLKSLLQQLGQEIPGLNTNPQSNDNVIARIDSLIKNLSDQGGRAAYNQIEAMVHRFVRLRGGTILSPNATAGNGYSGKPDPAQGLSNLLGGGGKGPASA